MRGTRPACIISSWYRRARSTWLNFSKPGQQQAGLRGDADRLVQPAGMHTRVQACLEPCNSSSRFRV